MSKSEQFVCTECGFKSPKWMGRCTSCREWDTFKKVANVDSKSTSSKVVEAEIHKAVKVNKTSKKKRLSSRFSEFDRVLGGGIVKGAVMLMGGEPGIGKTTMLLQLVSNISSQKKRGIYVTAEESLEQISIHIKRLGLSDNFEIICDNDVDAIIKALSNEKADIVVIDSIQTIKTEDLGGIPGGVGQVRECASRIINHAKKHGTSIFLVSHITKKGEVAGPKILEHVVDSVFYIEGDSQSNVRLLRSVKNRFGSTREIGVFEMSNEGFSDATDPSKIFLLSKGDRVGVCKGVMYEGRRAILVEIQALTSKATFSVPQRVVSGMKKSKIQMLCAVLSKYTKADLSQRDVYVNVANGMKIDNDADIDLVAAIAILSSYFNKRTSSDMVAIGEVSLTGQIYTSPGIKDKFKATRQLGYKKIVIPTEGKKSILRGGRRYCQGISSINEIKKILE